MSDTKAEGEVRRKTKEEILKKHVNDIYLFTHGTLEKREQFTKAVIQAMDEYASQCVLFYHEPAPLEGKGDEKDKEIARLKNELETFKDAYVERNDAYNKIVDGSKKIYDNMAAEIERLKALIEKMVKDEVLRVAKMWDDPQEEIEKDLKFYWQQFKAENNL